MKSLSLCDFNKERLTSSSVLSFNDIYCGNNIFDGEIYLSYLGKCFLDGKDIIQLSNMFDLCLLTHKTGMTSPYNIKNSRLVASEYWFFMFLQSPYIDDVKHFRFLCNTRGKGLRLALIQPLFCDDVSSHYYKINSILNESVETFESIKFIQERYRSRYYKQLYGIETLPKTETEVLKYKLTGISEFCKLLKE